MSMNPVTESKVSVLLSNNALLQAQKQDTSRRDQLASLFTASFAAAALTIKPAQAAILGIEGAKEKDDEYKSYTVSSCPL